MSANDGSIAIGLTPSGSKYGVNSSSSLYVMSVTANTRESRYHPRNSVQWLKFSMNPVLFIALSGLQAATKRLGVSANNVANALTSRPTTGPNARPAGVFAAQEAVDRASGGGGVRTEVRERDPATVIGPDPASPTGLSAFPHVDLVEEAVNQKVALATYKANAAVICTQQEIDDALLDIET